MAKGRDKKTPRQASRRPKSSPKPPPKVAARPSSSDDAAVVPTPRRDSNVVIAGVGASAGGLEAFSALLHALPEAPGLALVLVQHLAPHHESALPTLLASTTKLPVVQAADGMKVETDHVYVIPPNARIGVQDHQLRLLPRPTDDSQYVPIDFFFRSLADSQREGAIGVVMSGTASDGSMGIRDIKGVGGITLAQDPATAKYDGMPRAAISTGMVDMVLPPDGLAAKLVEIARHPYLIDARTPIEAPADDDAPRTISDDQLQRVFKVLRAATGVDFRHYKLPTITRRLHRRMVLHRIAKVDQYVRYLTDHPSEVQALHQDLLIHVTRFFREPESFAILRDRIFPRILQHPRGDQPIRIWVAGCSSGEEAYSIAISLLETIGANEASAVPIQVFATDVSEHAIEQARNGTYPESIAVDVSPERLRRFFTKTDTGYRVAKAVRDVCIFARQDLTRDPPFSKLDLVACRNVMIYMTPVLQNRLLSIFHYALRPNGYLMLGHAETIGTLSELFEIEDKRHRIYEKKLADAALPAMRFDADHVRPAPTSQPRAVSRLEHLVQHEADRIALERYAPPGVIVDEDLQILQFRGQTGRFLEPAPGDPSTSLLKMAREGLMHGLRATFQAARKTTGPVRKDGLKVKYDGSFGDVGVEVIPLGGPGHGNFLVLFHAGTAPPAVAAPPEQPATGRPGKDHADRMRQLEAELAASREYLQSIIQEVEAANEELQSANEEVLSSNEELQSTNEELDTAKEELQSTNEELNTLNEELHGRNTELSRVNSDLVNLLGSIQIAIVIVASDLRIRRFTPMAERSLNLIATDVGRPISHLKPNIDCPDLEKIILHAIDTVTPQEREVQDRQGNWFALRVRPYKNIENRIDGAVLALFDIHAAKEQDRELRRTRGFAEAIFNVVPLPLIVLDANLAIQQMNVAFCEAFGYHPDGIRGRKLAELDDGAWNVEPFGERLRAAAGDGIRVEAFPLTLSLPRRGVTHLMVSMSRVDGAAEGEPSLLLTLADGSAEDGR